MKYLKLIYHYFTLREKIILVLSYTAIITSFFVFKQHDYFTLVASLLGTTSILLSSKGNPAGELMMVFFSLMYGYISYTAKYYGEMLSYIFMTGLISLWAFIVWLCHPFNGKRSEVSTAKLNKKDIIELIVFTILVTVAFYFILKYFNTNHLILSTISIATSFAALFLTLKRSPYFALSYIFNDAIIVGLWSLMIKEDISYLPTLICFIMFLINDISSFYSWLKMAKRQDTIMGNKSN